MKAEESKVNVLTKLSEARTYIKGLDVVKDGRNTFSKYDYFTPVLVSSLVHQACTQFGLTTLFSLMADEYGMYGKLDVVDLATSETTTFIMRTEVPSIKATNITQQYGGAETYTQRYLKMSAFDIMDNAIEFDSKDNSKSAVRPKLKAGTPAYTKALAYVKKGGAITLIEKKYDIVDIAKFTADVKAS